MATPSETAEADAFRYVRKLRRLYLHAFQYVIVVGGLVAINLVSSPRYLWSLWVMLGWGLGLLAHAAMVFRPDWMPGPQWERRQVEKRLGRPL